MVVIVILGILAALVVPKIMSRPDEARIVKARADIGTLENALSMYKLDNFQYPSTDQGLQALVEKPATTPEPRHWKEGGYIARLPYDPWQNDYRYLSPGTQGEIDIFSVGPDGRPSEDDIGNWMIR